MLDHTDEARAFHRGIELFNERDFFEAHEVWEDIWHNASGDRRRFYQGLIQLAVTLEHVRRGNPRGVQNVFASATTKFVNLPDVYMGIDVRQLTSQVRNLVQPVLDLPSHMFDPGKERGLDLPVDLTRAPTIELRYDPFE